MKLIFSKSCHPDSFQFAKAYHLLRHSLNILIFMISEDVTLPKSASVIHLKLLSKDFLHKCKSSNELSFRNKFSVPIFETTEEPEESV